MRCKSCDYPLWNLKARQCPECGRPFAPSEFEFVPNSVRFCCPHCDQAYYGTDPTGLLAPREFQCVSCNQRIHMDQMVLRPAEGVSETQTQALEMPWLERRRLGFFRAWLRTVGRSMTAPHLLMRSLPPESSVRQAWWFAAFTSLVTFAGGIGVALLVVAMLSLASGSRNAMQTFAVGAGLTIGNVLGVLVLLLIWGACTHGILKMIASPAHTIRRTYEAVLYSVGPILPVAVPCLGPYCGSWVMWIWCVVSAAIMVAEGQRVGGGRAAIATAAFPVAAILLLVGGYVALIAAMVGGMPMRAMTTTMDTAQLATALRAHLASQGAWPGHGLELMSTSSLGAAQFIAGMSQTTETAVPVGDTTLDRVALLPPNRQRLAIQSVAAALPATVIAHRVGDFVFTYHGMQPQGADPQLWIVILSLDPDANPVPMRGLSSVACADGKVQVLSGSLSAQLQAQNTLRAKYGLAPLPDPSTVTHAAPATAPAGQLPSAQQPP